MNYPQGNCCICGATCRVVKMLTFSYWYCDKCKDEPREVWLRTNNRPRGAKEKYALSTDEDIVISKPGVYRLEYIDGSRDFFEQKPGDSEFRLHREFFRSTTRIDDSDMPSRIRMQAAEGTDKGGTQGNGVGSFSDQAIGNKGCGELPYKVIQWDHKTHLDAEAAGIPYVTQDSSAGTWWYSDTKGNVRILTDEEAAAAGLAGSGSVPLPPPDPVW